MLTQFSQFVVREKKDDQFGETFEGGARERRQRVVLREEGIILDIPSPITVPRHQINVTVSCYPKVA